MVSILFDEIVIVVIFFCAKFLLIIIGSVINCSQLLIFKYINIQGIPKGELHLCVEERRQENLSKNRYKTILPCKFKKTDF